MKLPPLSLICLITALPAMAEQVSGPQVADISPQARPGYIGVRPGPVLPLMVEVFNDRFDRETSALAQRAGTQSPFCGEGAEPTATGPAEASVMLLSLYQSGQFRQGTGTVIRGSGVDGAPDRVLTSSHVLPAAELTQDGVWSPLTRVMAFGSDGDFLADLAPVLSGDVDRLDRMNDPDMIFDDVAVLEPVRFAGPDQERLWAERGAPLSPAQPESLLALFQPPGSVALNPGMSGAGVFDQDGALIGVMGYTLFLSGDPFLDRPRTGYEDRFLTRHRSGEGASWAHGLAELTATAGKTLRRDNVGYAVPVRHKQIRDALNAPDLTQGPDVPSGTAGEATLFGYPRLTCLSVDVHYAGGGLPEVSDTLRALTPFDLTPLFGFPLEEIIIAEASP